LDGAVAPALREAGHDVLEVRRWQPGASDAAVLKRAFELGRILITLDNDVGRLVFAQGLAHCGVLRLVGFTSDEEPEACVAAMHRFGNELERGAWVVLEPDGSRIRD
jgi:predicted nuclease of predicted toxin-antitoxin system